MSIPWAVAGGAALAATIAAAGPRAARAQVAAAPPPLAARIHAQAQAARAPSTVDGDVIAAASRWTADRRTILTDAVVRTAGGDVDVVELGGHVDGLTMMVIHGAPRLEPGQHVRLTVHPTEAMAGGRTTRPRWVVDDAELLAAAGAAGPGAATPYVRTPTNKTNVPVYWAKSCAQVWRAKEGTTAIAGDAEQAVMSQSMDVWNTGVAGCSYIDLVDMGTVDSEVGNDGKNLIKIRDTEWCRPAVDGNDMHCFSPQAAGITTLLFVDDASNDRNGELIDADVELNGVDFAISTNGQTLSDAGCQADLENTLVHELGHLLGLGHTCLGPADPPRTDGDGNPVPLCSETTDARIVDATMYPFQVCGETTKASLSDDDIAAICAIYPKANDPGECGPPDDLSGGCCDQGAAGPRGSLALALAVGLGFGVRRRRVPARARRGV